MLEKADGAVRRLKNITNLSLKSRQLPFPQHRSTEDQVTYIAQKVEDGFQTKQHTLTAWIDMEKAYDNTRSGKMGSV